MIPCTCMFAVTFLKAVSHCSVLQMQPEADVQTTQCTHFRPEIIMMMIMVTDADDDNAIDDDNDSDDATDLNAESLRHDSPDNS